MEFNCEFHSKDMCDWYNNLYRCIVTSISKASPTPGIKSFIGEHAGCRTNADVKVLRIVNQPLMVFPRNLHKVFPYLTHLVLQSCGISKISKDDLIGLESLEHLSLYRNNLRTLPVDLFVNMRNLRRIFFGQNPLEIVDPQIIEPIEHILEYANFENHFINEAFSKRYPMSFSASAKQMMENWKNPIWDVDPIPDAKTAIPNWEQHELIQTKFTEFKASGKLSDFTIKVRGKEFKVHKAILAAQSSVFEEIFTRGDVDVATWKNFSDETFEAFLDYFYSGKLDDQVPSMEMFELASVLKVPVLIQLSTDKIINGLKESNAPEVFNLGHQHQSDELKQTAFGVIRKMFPDIPAGLIDDQDRINKIIAAKRELEAILADVKALKI